MYGGDYYVMTDETVCKQNVNNVLKPDIDALSTKPKLLT